MRVFELSLQEVQNEALVQYKQPSAHDVHIPLLIKNPVVVIGGKQPTQFVGLVQ
jgi:hypothetical protein